MRLRLLLVSTVLAASYSSAEKAAVNFHLDPMVGTGLDRNKLITGAALKVDTAAIKVLGPIAPQIEFFGASATDRSYLHEGSVFGGGIGLRLRLFNDERGYAFNPGQHGRSGNVWGNAWVDSHFTVASGGFGPGFDVGLGAEFSLIEGLSVGPLAKYMFFSQRVGTDGAPNMLLMFGISFTIGAPQTTPADADYDGDGIRGDNDKCVDEPEDVDGYQDVDGCPDKDNDKDGIEDDVDACRDDAEDKDGIADQDGCPEVDADKDGIDDEKDSCPEVAGSPGGQGCLDTDKDGDGVVDRLDECLDVKGVAENKGCPDSDADQDGTVDRLDGCKNEVGPVSNKGCPYPDADSDGVADNLDNCINEAGPANNQGCPAAKKQLVVITTEKLVIKEKVFFNTNKATIQARSNGMLNQLASVLATHPEITVVQVEGHTDNSGNAAKNLELSAQRAKAVVDYLVLQGVAADRLKAVGFGADRPADVNTTPAGRENNRRVEFNILSH